jgi:hypothetical protein
MKAGNIRKLRNYRFVLLPVTGWIVCDYGVYDISTLYAIH